MRPAVFDPAALTLAAAGVLAVAAPMAIGADALDTVLHPARDAGVWLARTLGRAQTNLSFVTWSDAGPHNRWIISSATALSSLGLIPFLATAGSLVRLAGAVGLVCGVLIAIASIPWPVAYGDRTPVGAIVVFFSPVVSMATWHVAQFVGHRARNGDVTLAIPSAARTPIRAVVSVLVLVGLSAGLLLSMALPGEEIVVTHRLVCIDTETGARIWHADAFTTPPAVTSPLNSHATPSPVVEDGTVVVAFGFGVAAFDADGRRLWSKTVPGWIQSSLYGAGSSPVADHGVVYLTNDREYGAERRSQVVAYDVKTGGALASRT